MYSRVLKEKHDLCKSLIDRLAGDFKYVSILGKHTTGMMVRVTTSSTSVSDSMNQEYGYVVKLFNGYNYSEYSFADITEDTIDAIEKGVRESVKLPQKMLDSHAQMGIMPDEPLVKDFARPITGPDYTAEEIVEKLTAIRNTISSVSDKIVQAGASYSVYDVSAMFISPNRDLTQEYGWVNVYGFAVARDGEKIQQARGGAAENSRENCFAIMESKAKGVGELAVELLSAELIEPGTYDIITDSSITGLIAHEAFGHGVEMDMFVKHRAKSRKYLNKRVASDLVNMHDGAAATQSCVGYFFDDDGVLAHDTLIIKNGILQTGISDAVSAMQLGTEPTGNGRRQSTSHKAYTRMTNTFFSAGTDKLSDMIASVKHGYMLYETSNGMEDPKNWNIQCVAQYGREIKDGKFTGKIVAPVVMSGYVPDLLQSISMVSDEWKVIGSGSCGKGYKEWVPVSDGGPCLKARCKLG